MITISISLSPYKVIKILMKFLILCTTFHDLFPQFNLVAQLCLTLRDPIDCSTPGFPVHHQLPELTRTHVHWVSDVILPSYPLSSPSPPAFSLPSTRVYFNESVLCIRWPKYWSFSISPSNEYSGLISFRIWSLFSPRDSQESFPTPELKNINSSVLSFL